MAKRVVVSSNTSWSIINFRKELIDFLISNKCEVFVISPFDKYTERIKENYNFRQISIDRKGQNIFKDIRTLIQYFKIYRSLKPDIALHFTIKPNIYGTIASYLLGIKSINNITGLGTIFTHKSLKFNLIGFLYKISLKLSSVVYVQNYYDFKIIRKSKILSDHPLRKLPGSGVNLDRFKPSLDNNETQELNFLCISRLIKEKGIIDYINACKELMPYDNIKCYLAGFIDEEDPTHIPYLQIKKWEEEKIIHFLGEFDDVREIIRKMDCIVLPSYYKEGTPKILIESASMGKPIITTREPGCKDVVDDHLTGYLIEKKDSLDLKSKMLKIYSDGKLKNRKMGMEGRKKMVTEYNQDIIFETYWQDILSLT